MRHPVCGLWSVMSEGMSQARGTGGIPPYVFKRLQNLKNQLFQWVILLSFLEIMEGYHTPLWLQKSATLALDTQGEKWDRVQMSSLLKRDYDLITL